MRVAIVNTHTEKGGASKAAFRLGQGLQQQGDEVRYLVKRMPVAEAEQEPDAGTILHFRQSEEMEALSALVDTLYIRENRPSAGRTLFTFPGLGENPALQRSLADSDIINLHWIEKFLTPADLSALFRLDKPVVWTLHDQRPFTGGCHYSDGCSRYRDACGDCPQLQDDPLDLSRVALARRRASITTRRLTLVSPSRWLADQAASSALFNDCRIEVIANGIDTDIFRAADKRAAKAALGIDPDAIALMFGAQNSRELRKGFDVLSEAVQQLATAPETRALVDRQYLCVVHVGMENEDTASLSLPVVNTGYIHDDREMAAVYNAADIFVLPSREDNLPNTMLESLACATPVIATAAGGITEVVDASNGIVIDGPDAGALARAMTTLAGDESRRRELGKNGAALIQQHYTLEQQGRAYHDLFNELAQLPLADTDHEGVAAIDEELLAFAGNCAGRFGVRLQEYDYFRRRSRKLEELKYRFNKLEQHFLELLADAKRLAGTSARRQPRKKYESYRAFVSTVHRSAAYDNNRIREEQDDEQADD